MVLRPISQHVQSSSSSGDALDTDQCFNARLISKEKKIMSEYAVYQAEYKDKECLVKALTEMGYAENQIEVHETAQQLFDYHGRATTYTDKNGDKAEIIVRRKNVGGAANDLGFRKNAEGKYQPIISQYDSGKHNTKWLDGLKKSYTEAVTHKEAKKRGLKFHSRTVVNGKVVVKYLQV
jgi:Protein of unknown function (DUF1257)